MSNHNSNSSKSAKNFHTEVDVRDRGFAQRMFLNEAINKLLQYTQPLSAELVSLRNHNQKLVNRVLAQDISVLHPIPAYPKALMDGYAIKSENTKGASSNFPKKFLIVGQRDSSEQISDTKLLKHGEAIKIPTGGVLPAGSDAVVPIEETTRVVDENKNEFIIIRDETYPFKHVAQIGEDFPENALIYTKGTILREIDVGTLSALGLHHVQLYQVPKIAVFATGNEILDQEDLIPNPRSGQVYDANSYMLSEYIQHFGWKAHHYSVIPDEKETITSQLKQSLLGNDVVMFTGGTAVGPKDLAAIVIAEQGELIIHGIHTKPASPTAAGLIDNKLVFALPGFPIASIIGFLYLALPVLKKLAGISSLYHFLEVPAILEKNVKSKIGRREFLRVKLKQQRSGSLSVEPIATSGASFLSSMVFANGIVEIPEEIEELNAGDTVKVQIITEWIKDIISPKE